MARKKTEQIKDDYYLALQEDFRNFAHVCFEHLNLPNLTPIQNEMCEFLQYGPDRKYIEGYRGVGKSTLASLYVLWVLKFHDRNARFLIVSASQSRSLAFSTFCKRLIHEMPLLSDMIPNDNCRDSVISFDVAGSTSAHAPSIKCVGITGMLTGSRATHIISDDCESFSNSATQEARQRLINQTAEFNAILSVGGSIIYLGTKQSFSSIYNELPAKGFTCKLWPARYPTLDKIDSYNGHLAESIYNGALNPANSGLPTDPLRFNEYELMTREASYGKSMFALQFLLSCELSDQLKYPLKMSDAIITDLDLDRCPLHITYCSSVDRQIKDIQHYGFPSDRYYSPLSVSNETCEYEGKVMYVDPSGAGKDKTAYAVVFQNMGKLYLMDFDGLDGGFSEPTLKQLAEVAKKYKVNEILCESNFGMGAFTQLLKPVLQKINYPCMVTDKRSTRQKEVRICEILEVLLNSHKLIINKGAIRRDVEKNLDSKEHSLIYQMCYITRVRGCLSHDDLVDAVAGACEYFIESFARNEDTALSDHKEHLLMLELDTFMNGVFMFDHQPSNSWFN